MGGDRRLLWRFEMVWPRATRTKTRRAYGLISNISAHIAFWVRRFTKRDHFHEARDCLLGLRQTADRRERNVLMVRTAEEIALGSPGGDSEGHFAFCEQAVGQAAAHRRLAAATAPAGVGSILAHGRSAKSRPPSLSVCRKSKS
jgi:hypothetical protein